MTIYSLDELLFLFGSSLLFHVQFPLKSVLSGLIWQGPQSPGHTIDGVLTLLASMTLEKSASFHIFWCWGPQLKPPSWECSLLGLLSTACGSGWEQPGAGGGEASGGRSSETQALSVCSGTFHMNSQPRKPTFPKAPVASGTRDGREKVSPPVDISFDYSLTTGAYWHLQFTTLEVLLMTTALSKEHWRNEFQTQHSSQFQVYLSIFTEICSCHR